MHAWTKESFQWNLRISQAEVMSHSGGKCEVLVSHVLGDITINGWDIFALECHLLAGGAF